MAKKAKKNDAIMTGILVTRFKMGLINFKDLEQMAEDMSVENSLGSAICYAPQSTSWLQIEARSPVLWTNTTLLAM